MKESYSQYGQDIILNDRIFKNKKNGYFIDIGAYDGVCFSNTLLYEEKFDWNGICIEANPTTFKELKNNRKCECINKGVWEKNKIMKFWEMTGGQSMLGGLEESYDERHLYRIEEELKQYNQTKKVIEVECITFMDIVEQYKCPTIDFLSIDVEGSEEPILKSIDYEKIDIKIIACENNYNSNELIEFYKTINFTFLGKIYTDDVFVNNKFLKN